MTYEYKDCGVDNSNNFKVFENDLPIKSVSMSKLKIDNVKGHIEYICHCDFLLFLFNSKGLRRARHKNILRYLET
jgi:hypothetical protein